jgi:hypothetical protein
LLLSMILPVRSSMRIAWHYPSFERVGVALVLQWLHRCRWSGSMRGQWPLNVRTSVGLEGPLRRDDMKSVVDIFSDWGSKIRGCFEISKKISPFLLLIKY